MVLIKLMKFIVESSRIFCETDQPIFLLNISIELILLGEIQLPGYFERNTSNNVIYDPQIECSGQCHVL